MNSDASTSHQPILPRISIRWYFAMLFIVACLVSVIIRSSDPQTWGMTLILLLGALSTFLVVSASCFLIAFLVGAVKEIVFSEPSQPQSPFATETLPPQVIPPQAVRD